MPDVLAIAALVAFFSIAVLFVRACERIIGSDLESESQEDTQLDLNRRDSGEVAA